MIPSVNSHRFNVMLAFVPEVLVNKLKTLINVLVGVKSQTFVVYMV